MANMFVRQCCQLNRKVVVASNDDDDDDELTSGIRNIPEERFFTTQDDERAEANIQAEGEKSKDIISTLDDSIANSYTFILKRTIQKEESCREKTNSLTFVI